MKLDTNGLLDFIKHPRNVIVVCAPIPFFMGLHLALELFGYEPLPFLPLAAVPVSFYYALNVTRWIKNKQPHLGLLKTTPPAPPPASPPPS